MCPTPSRPEAGMQLKATRQRAKLSTREVERLSDKLAREKNNQEYYLSHGWLSEIEKGKFTPNIYKLFSLSLIYGRSYQEMLALFGVNILDLGSSELQMGLPKTRMVNAPRIVTNSSEELPLTSLRGLRLGETNLVPKMVEQLDKIPFALLGRLDIRNRLYGYVGTEDYTLFPMVRPGSFVEIDSSQRKIAAGKWSSDYDRPIHFVELRDGYACAWCEMHSARLFLIPSPQSKSSVRELRYPMDAEIVGRVTAVTMRISEVVGR